MFELFQNQMLLREHYELKLKNNIGGSNISKYFFKINRILHAYNLNVLTSFLLQYCHFSLSFVTIKNELSTVTHHPWGNLSSKK